jgi:hypothetical protein
MEFPSYLPQPDETLSKWVGDYLKQLRGTKTHAQIAQRAKIDDLDEKRIEEIESGVFRLDLGIFRHVLRRGYGRELEDVLAKLYQAFSSRFNAKKARPFARDYYYAICLLADGKKQATPFLVGGDLENFLWAVPLRKLKNQPLSVDLLELAPARVKKHSGETTGGFHDGVEVIHLINGKVKVSVDSGAEGPIIRELRKGDSIHFNSQREHQIMNSGSTTSALLLIIRLSNNPISKTRFR